MSVPSSTQTLLRMMIFLLWLTVQFTSQPSLAYNLYPMPDNWEPVAVLNFTDNHNIASLLTGDSLVPNATKCVYHLNTHLNASQVCKRQLYDFIKIDMDNAYASYRGIIKHEERLELIDTYVKFMLTCYFRLACVHCPAEQVTEYRKAVEAWFPLYACKDLVCNHQEWQSPRLTDCFDPPFTELAQCDAALEQAAATEQCTAQVQPKLNQSKHDVARRVKRDAEYANYMCMMAQVCQHCLPEHVPKYFAYWDKVGDLALDESWRFWSIPKRKCTVDYTLMNALIIGAVVAVVGFIISLICCRKCSAKRTRKFGSLGRSSSSSKSRTTSRSSSSSVKAK